MFFEALMLICFGFAWPFSIYTSYSSRKNSGKSLRFLVVILVGYISGIINKAFFDYDPTIYLYALNGLMVALDIIIYLRNTRYTKT